MRSQLAHLQLEIEGLKSENETLRRELECRPLRSENDGVRSENEELRGELARRERVGGGDRVRRRVNPRDMCELKWLIYFRASGSSASRGQDRVLKAQVLAVVRAGLEALFKTDPSFCDRECVTFWAAQQRPDWQAFRVDYVGFNLVAFRTGMKAALAESGLPADAVRTTQPPSVALYRQVPEVPPLFAGTLAELARALQDSLEQVFIA